MSQWDQLDNQNNGSLEDNVTSDHYTSESTADIYNTPDVTGGGTLSETSAAETVPADVVVDSTPVEKETESAPAPYNYTPYNNNPYGNSSYGGQPRNDPYNNNQNNPYSDSTYNNQYGSNPYNSNPYGNSQHSGNPYGNNHYNGNPYDNIRFGSNNPYGNDQNNGSSYGNGQYENNPYGGSPYNNSQYGNNQYNSRNDSNPYDNSQYGSNQYNNRNGGDPYSSSQYGNNQYNNQYNSNPYNNNPYGGQVPPNSNQYNPYMVPPKKSKNGLIIGIVIAVIVLFLIAVFALAYRAITLLSENNSRNRSSREEYHFDYDDDDWGKSRRHDDDYHDDGYYDDDYYDDDWYDDYDDYYDDYYDDDYYDEDSEYYRLDDDIRWDLSYSVEFDSYEDGGDIQDNVYMAILYPVIAGDDVPNLNRLNDKILDEVDFLKSLADDVEDDMELDVDAEAYVTYMDEEKLSIVFHETLYLSYEDGEIADAAYYLYSINFDMKNGVVMDNQNIIDADDDFSVDFRERSDIQNGEINYLTMMSDQEITDYFNSSDIIIFYTPMGMEIGFNYDQGWVTVTYPDYEQYLKVF